MLNSTHHLYKYITYDKFDYISKYNVDANLGASGIGQLINTQCVIKPILYFMIDFHCKPWSGTNPKTEPF